MSRDEALYPNPEVFIPERFIATAVQEAAVDPNLYVFGFGRR